MKMLKFWMVKKGMNVGAYRSNIAFAYRVYGKGVTWWGWVGLGLD